LNNLAGVTASIWAKIDKTGRAQLVYKHVTLGIRVEYGKVYCAVGTSASKNFYETSGINVDYVGSWHHFVVTFDGRDVKCYVDGNLIGMKSSPALDTVRDGSWDLTVGYHQFKADRNVEGNLQDFRIYNTSMTAEEIQGWYSTSGQKCVQ
jgi:hypothetical protein